MNKPKLIHAPFTPEQIEGLNFYQTIGIYHEYTCGGNHKSDRSLIATREGLICKKCNYKQDYALESSSNLNELKKNLKKFKDKFKI